MEQAASINRADSLVWIFCGISLLSVLLGFLTGASSSPVAGVAITSAFGLVVAIFGFYNKISIEKGLEPITLSVEADNVSENQPTYCSSIQNYESLAASINTSLNRTGKILVIFAISFSIGLGLGVKLRVGDIFKEPTKIKQFPWVTSKPPIKSENAIDWVIVQERMLKLGYSEAQVKELYKIEFDEIQKNGSEREIFNPFDKNNHALSSLFTPNEDAINDSSESKKPLITDHSARTHLGDS